MAVTYGFYDSLNHDRLYNAQQMSAIFDGIINDGVFMSVGNQFHTVAGTGMQVIVKSGRAWFDSTWTLNDAEYPLSIDAADVLLTRIDAVVLEVNSEVATRANTIKVVKGTPASTPAKPTLTNTATIHQHALAYVTVAKNTTAITNSMIEIVVGKTETPYVTAILQTTDITDLFKKWENDFQVWFETVKGTLDGDVALNLQNQIDHCVKKADKATSADIEAGTIDKWVDASLLSSKLIPYGTIIKTNAIPITDEHYVECLGQHLPLSEYTEFSNRVYCTTGPNITQITYTNNSEYLYDNSIFIFETYKKIVYQYTISGEGSYYNYDVYDMETKTTTPYSFYSGTYTGVIYSHKIEFSHYIYMIGHGVMWRFDILTGQLNQHKTFSYNSESFGGSGIKTVLRGTRLYIIYYKNSDYDDCYSNTEGTNDVNPIYVVIYNLENDTYTSYKMTDIVGQPLKQSTIITNDTIYFTTKVKPSSGNQRPILYRYNLTSQYLVTIDSSNPEYDTLVCTDRYLYVASNSDGTEYIKASTYYHSNAGITYYTNFIITSFKNSSIVNSTKYYVSGSSDGILLFYFRNNSLYLYISGYDSPGYRNYFIDFKYYSGSIYPVNTSELPSTYDESQKLYSITVSSNYIAYTINKYKSKIAIIDYKNYLTLPYNRFSYMKIK